MNKEQKEIIKFINQNKDYYPEYLNEKIQKKISYGYTCDINQIYCHLKLKEINNTDYYEFYKVIKNNFNLNNIKILDVACGIIPILSSIIKENEKSTITAINNKMLFKNYKGIITKEFDLTKDYDVNNYDLIIGFRPCEVTEKIIQEAMQNKKDFCLYMCPCVMKPINNHHKGRWSQKRWYNYLEKVITDDKSYDLKVIIDDKLDDDCPIFIANYKR